MSDQPIQDPRIREAMEACRPGSDDLEDPALVFLAEQLAADPKLGHVFERLQRLDGTVAEAFGDVPVPDGLADRITARLCHFANGLGLAFVALYCVVDPALSSYVGIVLFLFLLTSARVLDRQDAAA